MERITANVSGRVRKERLGGRAYLVAPMTMIVPGVLPGSDGPLLYPPDETGRNPSAWNGMPITLNHPVDRDGKHISARSPEVADLQEMGRVYRSAANPLAGEAWFDVEATRRIDGTVLARLERGEQLELSTGLYTRNEPAPEGAVHNGRAYTHVARDLRPDHLAILTTQKGACSNQDGCGVNVTANVMTHDDIRTALGRQLRDRFVPKTPGSGPAASMSGGGMMDSPNCYVQDVLPNHVVYQHRDKTFQMGYSADHRSNTVTLSDGEPVEVRQTTSYKPVANQTPPPPEGGPTVALTPERKREIVGLLVNCKCQEARPWNGKDEATLNAVPDEKLEAYEEWAKATPPVVPVAQPVVNAVPAVPKQQTVEEHIAGMPKDIQVMVRRGLASDAADKKRFIEAIVANKANQFTPEYLAGKDTDELGGMAALAGYQAGPSQPAMFLPHYQGMVPVYNAAAEPPLEPMDLPVMSFSKAS